MLIRGSCSSGRRLCCCCSVKAGEANPRVVPDPLDQHPIRLFVVCLMERWFGIGRRIVGNVVEHISSEVPPFLFVVGSIDRSMLTWYNSDSPRINARLDASTHENSVQWKNFVFGGLQLSALYSSRAASFYLIQTRHVIL
jgi:hypothetical protein